MKPDKKRMRHLRESLIVNICDDEAAMVRYLARKALNAERDRVISDLKTRLTEAKDMGLITAIDASFLSALLMTR